MPFLVARDFEIKLLDGIFLLPAQDLGITRYVLHAPVIDRIQLLTDLEADLLLDGIFAIDNHPFDFSACMIKIDHDLPLCI